MWMSFLLVDVYKVNGRRHPRCEQLACPPPTHTPHPPPPRAWARGGLHARGRDNTLDWRVLMMNSTAHFRRLRRYVDAVSDIMGPRHAAVLSACQLVTMALAALGLMIAGARRGGAVNVRCC